MLPAEYDIAGKIAFITGAERGIGKGIAQVLAEAGADIALNALTPKYVEHTAAEIAKASGRRVVPVLADVTNTEGVQGAIESVMKEFGQIDILINNLGDSIRKLLVALPGKANTAPTLSDDELKFVMDINLTEAILCTRAVGPHMLERHSGKIINISSWTARQGGGERVVYTIAKTALVGFTRAQALEWAPYGVHANAIAPGLFPDPVTSGEERARQTAQRAAQLVPLGRPGQLREV
jgi:NAD(P)-dependent dehydrogenase (short-subunit alcohol dehydrogenase family)